MIETFVALLLLSGEPASEPPLTRAEALQLSPAEAARRSLAQLGETFAEMQVGYPLPPSDDPALQSIYFWTKPRPIGDGLCGARKLSVQFSPLKTADAQAIARAGRYSRVPSSAYDLDIQDVIRRPDEAAPPGADPCAGSTSAKGFVGVDNRHAAGRALRLFRQAVSGAKSRRPDFKLRCVQAESACARPREMLARFSFADLEYIRFIDCTDPKGGGSCHAVHLADPDEPADYQWRIDIVGSGHPDHRLESIAMTRIRRPVL